MSLAIAIRIELPNSGNTAKSLSLLRHDTSTTCKDLANAIFRTLKLTSLQLKLTSLQMQRALPTNLQMQRALPTNLQIQKALPTNLQIQRMFPTSLRTLRRISVYTLHRCNFLRLQILPMIICLRRLNLALPSIETKALAISTYIKVTLTESELDGKARVKVLSPRIKLAMRIKLCSRSSRN